MKDTCPTNEKKQLQTKINVGKHRKIKKNYTDSIKKREWTQAVRKGKQFLSHRKHPPCYSV